MISYFADGPINGQKRDIPAYTPVYRVPIVKKITVDYWEASADLSKTDVWPNPRVGRYLLSSINLRTGEPIYIFDGIER